MKVLFIASTGGHLTELLQLAPMFEDYDYHVITEKTKSTLSLRERFPNKVSYLLFGTKDYMWTYPFKFIANCFKSMFLYCRIRPKYIVTTGTHTAVPICYFGKLFGSKIIFIETIANTKTKTLSGKMIYPIANLFIVQWESLLQEYPKAIYGGWVF
jgi:UDP-N-acetylglucosamine:LPS N-acetylglucosamine transferase